MLARSLLVALCVASLGAAACGRYGPPRRGEPARDPSIQIEKNGPTEEPEEEEEPPPR